MELTITKHSLSAALSRTSGIADRKSSMQVLSNVLIDATEEQDSVRIAATDLNSSAFGFFPAIIKEPGIVTVSAKTLYDVVKSMPEGSIVIRTEGDQVHLVSGRASFKLLGLPADDFPRLPEATEAEFFEIDTAYLSKMIEQTSFSISTDETRSHINGALFQGDGKNLRMVTTDGHRLSKVEFRIEEAGFYNFSMVIPNKGIFEIRKLVEDGLGVVSLAVHDGSVFLKRQIEIEKEQEGADAITAEFTLVSKLIEAEFPPYDQVIPTSNERVVVVPRQPFMEALKRVSVVSTDRTLGVKLQISEGSLVIETNNPSVGEGSEQVDVAYEGEDLVIGFNARYFIDAVSVLGDEEVRLELSGSLDPAIVKDTEDTFIGVIMPMRI